MGKKIDQMQKKIDFLNLHIKSLEMYIYGYATGHGKTIDEVTKRLSEIEQTARDTYERSNNG